MEVESGMKRKYEVQEYAPLGIKAIFEAAVKRLQDSEWDMIEALEILCKDFLDFAVHNLN